MFLDIFCDIVIIGSEAKMYGIFSFIHSGHYAEV